MLAIIQSKIFCNFAGCAVWVRNLVSHFGEEHRLRDFENRVLRWKFGPKKEGYGSWGELNNDELHDLYYSPNIFRVIKSRRMRWAGHVESLGEGRGAYRVLVWRPEGNSPLGRTRRRWEYNIKMDIGEKKIDVLNCILLDQERFHSRAFVSTVMNLRCP
jgi:hypothetical protein